MVMYNWPGRLAKPGIQCLIIRPSDTLCKAHFPLSKGPPWWEAPHLGENGWAQYLTLEAENNRRILTTPTAALDFCSWFYVCFGAIAKFLGTVTWHLSKYFVIWDGGPWMLKLNSSQSLIHVRQTETPWPVFHRTVTLPSPIISEYHFPMSILYQPIRSVLLILIQVCFICSWFQKLEYSKVFKNSSHGF